MRSLEFKANTKSPFVRTGLDLQAAIGQEVYRTPSVFSFFKPEFRPSGKVSSANLVSPESQGKVVIAFSYFFALSRWLFFGTNVTTYIVRTHN
jgi:hypothetical protein